MKPLLSAAAFMGLATSTAAITAEETKPPPCPAPAAGMAIDELGMPIDKKDKKGKGIITAAGAPGAGSAACKHAINTKGTGTSGRATDPDQGCGDSAPARAIKTSATQNGQVLKHAINTKGTGAAGLGETTASSTGDPPAPEAETVHLYLKANGERVACTPARQDQAHDVHELEK